MHKGTAPPGIESREVGLAACLRAGWVPSSQGVHLS